MAPRGVRRGGGGHRRAAPARRPPRASVLVPPHEAEREPKPEAGDVPAQLVGGLRLLDEPHEAPFVVTRGRTGCALDSVRLAHDVLAGQSVAKWSVSPH